MLKSRYSEIEIGFCQKFGVAVVAESITLLKYAKTGQKISESESLMKSYLKEEQLQRIILFKGERVGRESLADECTLKID